MLSKPKIAYLGSDAICLPGLTYLHEQAAGLCEIVAIVSQPDRRQGRGKKLKANPVAEFAASHGIALLQPEKPGRELAAYLSEQNVALAFVMAYGHFLPKSLREAPAHGMMNFHGSILPAYRGASPVETAIALGEEETGVCLMQIAREMDAGDVADCERVRIEESDTATGVRAKIGQAVVPLLERNLEAALSGELKFSEQDHDDATFCRKISKEDAALDFKLPAKFIDARLRAFTPWPGGYFDHGNTRIKIGEVSWLPVPAKEEPGTVLAVGDSLDIATGEGVLQIYQVQRPGGKMMPVREFLLGYVLKQGERLPSVSGELLLRSDSA
ncbi:MAG: methionyl-tRNA formyltransferase [Verrucomicrobiota bacterium]